MKIKFAIVTAILVTLGACTNRSTSSPKDGTNAQGNADTTSHGEMGHENGSGGGSGMGQGSGGGNGMGQGSGGGGGTAKGTGTSGGQGHGGMDRKN
jgi:hypothetical protein